MDRIFDICRAISFNPRRLIEVGAAHPNTMRLRPFIERGYDVFLIEANPRLHYCLTKGFDADDFQSTWPKIPEAPHPEPGLEKFTNCKVINAAIVDKDRVGTVKLFERNSSTFVSGILSPAKLNDGYVENEKDTSYEVPAVSIDKFDNGCVDVLLSDTEGCEWYCIKNLFSRPKVIVLETHGDSYLNPKIMDINNWMNANGYLMIGSDRSDTLYLRV